MGGVRRRPAFGGRPGWARHRRRSAAFGGRARCVQPAVVGDSRVGSAAEGCGGAWRRMMAAAWTNIWGARAWR
jgi:hypothetical protein